MLRENKLDELFEYLEAVANGLESKTAEERVRRLLSYLKDNRNGLIPYRKRGLNLPQLPDGLVYKGMGNGEHNMFLVVAKRMKHRGACWSPQGGLKLCKLLCHKVSNTLVKTIESLTPFEIPERLQEPSMKPLLSSSKAPKKDGKGYEGKHASIPVTDYAITNETKEIIDWLKGKYFSLPSYF